MIYYGLHHNRNKSSDFSDCKAAPLALEGVTPAILSATTVGKLMIPSTWW